MLGKPAAPLWGGTPSDPLCGVTWGAGREGQDGCGVRRRGGTRQVAVFPHVLGDNGCGIPVRECGSPNADPP